MFGVGCATQKIQTVAEETEANEILDVLLEHNIKSTKVETGERDKRLFEIHISGGDDEYRAAIQLMEDHCLPQPVPAAIESSGLVSSMEVERSREMRRMKINIESLLRKLPGATCVDVNLVQPEDKTLSLNPYPASASVLVKYKTDKFTVNPDQVAKMVARSVPGLASSNVFVSLTRSPFRPLPNIDRARNLRRIGWVFGIGFTTILLFVAAAWYFRRRSTVGSTDSGRILSHTWTKGFLRRVSCGSKKTRKANRLK